MHRIVRILAIVSALVLESFIPSHAQTDWRPALQSSDYAKAAPILEIAALQGDGLAALNLAQIYDFGLETERNADLANAYYRIALRENVLGANAVYGQFLLDHTTPHHDFARGRELLEFAATKGDAAALVPLSMLMMTGTGGEPDLDRAYSLACQAQAHGQQVGFMARLETLLGLTAPNSCPK